MFRRPIILTLLAAGPLLAAAQQPTYDEVATKSYALYQQGSWKELLHYGREAVRSGQDFVLLRLRLGYAAVQLHNWSEALRHYEAVLREDSHNETAWYYTWLCRSYLNQPAAAGNALAHLTREQRAKEGLKPVAITGVGLESSYKLTDVTLREDALYTRLDGDLRVGWRWNLRQSGALYHQQIGARQLTAVKNNNQIDIRQWEYYAQLSGGLSRHLEVKGSYHFLYTPFNNFIYYNHVGQLALKYYGSSWDLQLSGAYAQLTDSTLQQYDAQLSWYPLGNLDLYAIGSASWNSNGGGFAFGRTVLGGRVWKNTWLEGAATLGHFRNTLEKDAQYVYHAIDPNRQKMGITAYYLAGKALLHAGYTYEERELAGYPNYVFHQHSITGGISWKL